MAIGVVNDDELEAELERLQPKSLSVPTAQIKQIEKGRGEGNKNVPAPLRKTIAETAITEGHGEAKELAEQFGVSESSVSAYQNGAHSTASYDEPNPDLIPTVTDARQKVVKKARKTMMAAIRAITAEKLEGAKVSDLAHVAKSMAGIVKDMEPKIEENEAGVKFVFLAPRIKKVEQFDVIDVGR